MAMTVKFFESLDGYSVPALPRGQIAQADTKGRRAYYEATFDEGGRLIEVTKFLDGQFDLRFEYRYDAAGNVISASVTSPDGEAVPIEVPAPAKQGRAVRA